MGETPQNAAFSLETFVAASSHQRDVKHLHRYAPFESSITSFSQPYRAHASVADLRKQRVDTKRLAGEARCRGHLSGTRFEKSLFGQRAMFLEEQFQLACQGGIFGAEFQQPRRAVQARHLECFVEPWAQGLPLLWTEFGHHFLRAADPPVYC